MKNILLFIFFLTNTIIIKAQIPEEYKELSKKLETQFASKIDSTIKLRKRCLLTYSSDSTFKCLHVTLKNEKTNLLNILLITDHQKLLKLKWDERKSFTIIDRNLSIVAYEISKKDGAKKGYLCGSVSWKNVC